MVSIAATRSPTAGGWLARLAGILRINRHGEPALTHQRLILYSWHE